MSSKKHRILHVIDQTESGGAQVVVLNILKFLKNHYSFEVAVLGASGQFSDAYKALEIPVHVLGSRHRWSIAPLFRLINLMRSRHYDIVHTHLMKSSILGTIAARRTGIRAIMHEHTGITQKVLSLYFPNIFSRFLYRWGYHYALHQADRIILLTHQVRNIYAQMYGINCDTMVIVPNGVDIAEHKSSYSTNNSTAIRTELGLSDKTSIATMIGRLEPAKDWETYLEVARQCRQANQKNITFLVVGSGSEESKLRTYSDKHELDNVFFLGYRKDVQALLHQSDVFLLTSRTESFGIVVLEAMVAGCPVIATRSGGPDTIITDGVDGLLADVGDVQAIVYHLEHLLSNEELRSSIIRNAHQEVKRYSLETTTKSTQEIYDEIINVKNTD
jgi:glycosyltransferase involved in cell wall biosynthesis